MPDIEKNQLSSNTIVTEINIRLKKPNLDSTDIFDLNELVMQAIDFLGNSTLRSRDKTELQKTLSKLKAQLTSKIDTYSIPPLTPNSTNDSKKKGTFRTRAGIRNRLLENIAKLEMALKIQFPTSPEIIQSSPEPAKPILLPPSGRTERWTLAGAIMGGLLFCTANILAFQLTHIFTLVQWHQWLPLMTFPMMIAVVSFLIVFSTALGATIGGTIAYAAAKPRLLGAQMHSSSAPCSSASVHPLPTGHGSLTQTAGQGSASQPTTDGPAPEHTSH